MAPAHLMTSLQQALTGPQLNLGGEEQAFSRGGNRLCFVHPRDPDLCIKVQRPDRTPQQKRSERGFPKNLKPLSAFDDNAQEFAVYRKIERHIGAPAFELTPFCHGYINTQWGPGLCSQLIRDDDNRIAITLKQYLWQQGKTPEILRLIAHFSQRWAALGMPSRKLLLHNIVLRQRDGKPHQLLVIDGLGWPDLLPLAWYLPALARHKARRRIADLDRAIDALLYKKEHQIDYGYHGWLEEDKRR